MSIVVHAYELGEMIPKTWWSSIYAVFYSTSLKLSRLVLPKNTNTLSLNARVFVY